MLRYAHDNGATCGSKELGHNYWDEIAGKSCRKIRTTGIMHTVMGLWGLHGWGSSMLLPELIEETLHCSGVSHASYTAGAAHAESTSWTHQIQD